MFDVLESNNLLIVYAKHFLFFEWKLEESDLRSNNTLRSSEFNMEDDKPSSLEFKVNGNGTTFLHLHNPKWVGNGRFVLNIYDKNNSSIDTQIVSTNSIISATIGLIPRISNVKSTQYPIRISCIAKTSNVALMKESNVIHENRRIELCSDFKSLLHQEMNTDVVLKVNEEVIKTHKSVLVARSPVFRKMFSHDSSESAENSVVIPDIKVPTVKKLLSFLYTAKVEKCNFDEALDLYYVADKYEVLSLREECREELLDKINVNNACSLFSLASRHNDEDLKEKVVQFVSANFKAVVNMNNLKEMSKDDVMLLMSLCAPNMK